MKWIGQHIWSLISRFRNKVYLEDIEEVTNEHSVMVGPDGILTKSVHPSERSRLQVRNNEGSTIPIGSPLYSKGEIGGSERILVGICDADDPAKMPCIGIAEVEMNTNSTKDNFAITQGVYNGNIHGFTGLTVNDILYVQDDGSLSQSKPTGQDSKVQNVGIVLKTNGTMCQGLLVSAIGRSNDIPNLNDGYIFLGNSSNISQPSSFSSTFENLTDVIIGSDEIKGSSGNVIFSSFSDVVKAPLGLFTNSISGYDNTDFELKAGGNIQFTLDVDNNETAQSFSFRDGGNMGTFTEIANLNQDGDLVIEGDLTVKGNQINGTSSTSVLTFGTGITTLTGSLETSSTIYSNRLWSYGTDGDIEIRSQNDINLIVDGNNNASGELKIKKAGSGGDDDIIVIDESGVMTMYGSQLGQPSISLQQNTQTTPYGPPVFDFFRNSVTVDNADIGRLDFKARDSGGSETIYAQIIGGTEESGAGTEGGKIRFKIASHDAELVDGLTIEDGDAEDEIDVTIANGSSSLTTVAGNLNITTNIELGHASDTTIARSAAGEVTIEGKKIITENKVKQQFNLTFIDDIGTTQHYLSWRDQYENSSSTSSDYQDTNYLVPANGRVVAVYLRVGNITATSDMTVKVYSQNAGFMQSQSQQEAESTTITATGDKFEVFAFYFDNAEHFQAGDLVLISVQNGTDAGGSQTHHVTAVLEFDYTQMGRTDSGELA